MESFKQFAEQRARSGAIVNISSVAAWENTYPLVTYKVTKAAPVEDLDSAIAYGRTLLGVMPGKVLLAGQSRGGFLAMHYAGLKPGEVLGVVNFSGGWYPLKSTKFEYATPLSSRKLRNRCERTGFFVVAQIDQQSFWTGTWPFGAFQ